MIRDDKKQGNRLPNKISDSFTDENQVGKCDEWNKYNCDFITFVFYSILLLLLFVCCLSGGIPESGSIAINCSEVESKTNPVLYESSVE